MHIATCRPARNMTGNGALDLVGLDGRNDINGDALVAENVGSNPSITAIVTKAAKNHNTLRRESEHSRSGDLASMLHERSLGGTLPFNQILEAQNLLDIQHGLHAAPPFSTTGASPVDSSSSVI